MDLRSHLLLLLRRWPVFVATFAVTVAGLVGASFLIEPTFRATSSLYVHADPERAGPSGSEESALSAQQRGDQLLAGRLKSYAMAVNSEAVLLAVIDRLSLDDTFSSLNERVTSEVVVDSFVLRIQVEDSTAKGAARIANEVSAQLPVAVAALDGEPSPQASLAQFSVVQQALPPQHRISPNLRLNAAVALLVGLFLGMLAAVLTEVFDNRLRRGAEVLANDVRFLGAVPVLRERVRQSLLEPTAQPRDLQDLFTRVAVDIRLAAGPAPLQLVVTAPGERSGTTSVAVNVATRLAAAGNQVLLVDTDSTRRVTDAAERVGVTQAAGLTGRPGLSDVLTERTELDAALAFWEPGGFTVLPAGRVPMNAAEMLGGAAFRRLLDVVGSAFDVIVFDTPAMLTHPHAGLLLREGRWVLVVAEAGGTRRSDFRGIVQAVRTTGAQLAGAVLTRSSRGTALAVSAGDSDDLRVPA